MIYLLLLLVAIWINVTEAKHEAKNGDKKHYPSLIGSFVAFFIFWAIVAVLDGNLNIRGAVLSFVGLYVPVRLFFDELFNAFAGNHFAYLGETSKLDILQKKVFGKSYFVRLSSKLLAAFFLFTEFGLGRLMNVESSPAFQWGVFVTFAMTVILFGFWYIRVNKH